VVMVGSRVPEDLARGSQFVFFVALDFTCVEEREGWGVRATNIKRISSFDRLCAVRRCPNSLPVGNHPLRACIEWWRELRQGAGVPRSDF